MIRPVQINIYGQVHWRNDCDGICSSIRCYSVSEEACRAHSTFTTCLKALVVPLGVTLCLKRLVPVFINSSNAFVVSLVPSEGICISIRCYSVSVEDCEASHVAT